MTTAYIIFYRLIINCLGSLLQPHDHPREKDESEYMIGGILKHRCQKKKWMIYVIYKDESKVFEDFKDWGELDLAYDDCTPPKVDAKGIPIPENKRGENIVISYAKKLGTDLPMALAKEIANLAGMQVAHLFPHLAEEAVSSQSSNDHPTEPVLQECQLTHLGGTQFTDGLLCKVDTKYYFQEDRKFSGLVCDGGCGEVPELPTVQSPCYVCDLFQKDKVSFCKCVFCLKCYSKLILAKEDKRPTRRGGAIRKV